MRQPDYVMWKFGITESVLGVTFHSLLHEALIDHFDTRAKETAPVRGGELPALIRQHDNMLPSRMGTRGEQTSAAYMGAARPSQRQ